jgi:hypothetical protein
MAPPDGPASTAGERDDEAVAIRNRGQERKFHLPNFLIVPLDTGLKHHFRIASTKQIAMKQRRGLAPSLCVEDQWASREQVIQQFGPYVPVEDSVFELVLEAAQAAVARGIAVLRAYLY